MRMIANTSCDLGVAKPRVLTVFHLLSWWKFLSVVHYLKNNGERSIPGNYHPISILPIISKIFESFVNNRISKYLGGITLFSHLPYGFSAFRSTADLPTVLSKCNYNSFDVGGETRAIALDISKAFDKVWHAGLLHKLRSYIVRSSVLSIVVSFLQDRPIKVVLDGQSSTSHGINASVPQGSVLGPTLFLVHIIDLPNGAIYADETTAHQHTNT